MSAVFIIAEAGVNHNGSLEIAKRLIDAAAESGADAVKFQTFRTESNITKSAPKAEYQVSSTGAAESQFEMVKKLELSRDDHFELRDYARKKGIMFLSTAFDLESVDLLVELGVDRLKIPSGEITNGPLILKIASKELPIILSTGMSTLEDIEVALGAIAFGYLGWTNPSVDSFFRAYTSEEGRAVLREKVTLLHCTTEYPAPINEVNLLAMKTMEEAFSLPVGYSDHTEGITVPIAAAALGAVVIEKHFTLDRNMEGPDHRASLEPVELRSMVKAVREVEMALGDGEKTVAPSEKKNMVIARRSLTAINDIAKGESFTDKNLGFMRPGNGISPMHYWEWIGKAAPKDYKKEEQVG